MRLPERKPNKEVRRAIKRKRNKLRLFANKKLLESGMRTYGNQSIQSCRFHIIEKIYNHIFKSDLELDYEKESRNKRNIKKGEKVYFIGNKDLKTVKIGFTTNVKRRLREIQTYAPFPVEILRVENGNKENETRYHIEFKNNHQYGEWFNIKGILEFHLFHQ